MARGDHRLRHDRDVAGLDADGARTTRSRSASAPSAGSTRTSRSRSSTRRPGAIVPRGERRRALHARLQRHARLLGRRRRRPRAAIDAAGWMHTGDLATMDDDGYVQHRRPDQGHDHPRRREHLSARDRGVPAHATRASRDAQVIGVPSERYGEEVMAWVTAASAGARADRRGPRRRSAAAGSRRTRCRATGSSSTPSR